LQSLSVLNVMHNEICDLLPLAQLSALTILRLSHNKIKDFSPLSSLRALEELWAQSLPCSSLAHVFAALQPLPVLHRIVYKPNPASLSHIPDDAYLPVFVSAFPVVQVLDGVTITSAVKDAALTRLHEPAIRKLITSLGNGSGCVSSKAPVSARAAINECGGSTNGVRLKKGSGSSSSQQRSTARPSSSASNRPHAPPPDHIPRAVTSMECADDGSVDPDSDALAPPVGLRGLLQQKEGGSSSCSLSNVGAIYGDIQRALVNLPRALQVT
jgi:hypothetical protein